MNNQDRQIRDKHIISLRKKGLTQQQIAYQINSYRELVGQVLIRNNIYHHNTKYLQSSLNHDYFNVLNTKSAYWAGFLAADGSVDNRNIIHLTLKLTDIEHIKIFAKEINSFHKIYLGSSKKNNKNYTYAGIHYTSKQQCNDLNKYYNVYPNKTLNYKYPNLNKKDLILSFISGYFDGDGCLSQNSNGNWICNFVGTYPFLRWIQTYLPKFNKNNNIYKHDNIYKLQCSGDNVIKIMSSFYNTSPFHLTRKYALFNKLLKEYKYD